LAASLGKNGELHFARRASNANFWGSGGPALGSSDDRRRADEMKVKGDGGRRGDARLTIDKRRAGHHPAACTHATMRYDL